MFRHDIGIRCQTKSSVQNLTRTVIKRNLYRESQYRVIKQQIAVIRITPLYDHGHDQLCISSLPQKLLTRAISVSISSPASNFCSSLIIAAKPSMKILTNSISDLPSLSVCSKIFCYKIS